MKGQGLMVSEKNILKIFLWKTDKPQNGAIFWHGGHNLNKLGKNPLGDAPCQISIQKLTLAQSAKVS